MTEYTTELGSLDSYRKGGAHIIDDDPRNYVFSNVFEAAANPRRSSGFAWRRTWNTSSRSCAPRAPRRGSRRGTTSSPCAWTAPSRWPSPGTRAQRRKATGLDGEPDGPRMGRIKTGRGHLALLPGGAAYRIAAVRPSVVLFQSIDGPLTAHKWADICQTD